MSDSKINIKCSDVCAKCHNLFIKLLKCNVQRCNKNFKLSEKSDVF